MARKPLRISFTDFLSITVFRLSYRLSASQDLVVQAAFACPLSPCRASKSITQDFITPSILGLSAFVPAVQFTQPADASNIVRINSSSVSLRDCPSLAAAWFKTGSSFICVTSRVSIMYVLSICYAQLIIINQGRNLFGFLSACFHADQTVAWLLSPKGFSRCKYSKTIELSHLLKQILSSL